MNSGKTIEILKVAHNYEEQGKVLIMTSAVDTRDGVGYVSSRIGMKRQAGELKMIRNILGYNIKKGGKTLLYFNRWGSSSWNAICVYDLARVVDELDVPVMAFGLKNDFHNELWRFQSTSCSWQCKIEEAKTICQYCSQQLYGFTNESWKTSIWQGTDPSGGNETYIQSVASII